MVIKGEGDRIQSGKFQSPKSLSMKLSFTANDSSYSLRSTVVITVNDPQEMITEEEENRYRLSLKKMMKIGIGIKKVKVGNGEALKV